MPYVSGSYAPTSTTLTGLSSGTYYVRVLAYSVLNPTGAISSAVTVTVP